MWRKYGTRILITLLFVFVFVAAWNLANSKAAPKSEASVNQPRIALIAHVADNPYWQVIKKGAEDAAKKRGCTLEYYGSKTANVYEDLELINMNIASKVDGLITYVQEDKKYSPVINKGIEKGIPIITIDTDAKSSKRIAYIGTDNFAAGRKAGKVLYYKANGAARIGVIMAGFTTTNQIERVEGFKSYLRGKSGFKIVSMETSNCSELNAKLAAEKIINKHPEVNFLYCTSSTDGIGAAKAVIEHGVQDKITIICFDDLPETLGFIKNGVIYATIVQRPYDMGYQSVNMMMDKIHGKSIKNINITKSIVVNVTNVESYNKNSKE